MTVLVKDSLRQRCRYWWLAEASCLGQVKVYGPSHHPASWVALEPYNTSGTNLPLWVPPDRVLPSCRSSLWTTLSSSWSIWTLTCPTSSATTSGFRRDGWLVGAVPFCAAQGMQGSHCMADHTCCCLLQLTMVPRLSDGLSASHLHVPWPHCPPVCVVAVCSVQPSGFVVAWKDCLSAHHGGL